MNWRLSPRVHLQNPRIDARAGDRQMRTAAEILRRFDDQAGVILADEVGMGKTYVALAVAVSVIEATGGRRPVLVKVPPSVQEKWPREWDVVRENCLSAGMEIRAPRKTITDGASFLRLLDDPESRRNHLIFITHIAMTSSLNDPFIRLALVGRALLNPALNRERDAFPRWAADLIDRRFRNEDLVRKLLKSSPMVWKQMYEDACDERLDDDPVPTGLLEVIDQIDLRPIADALHDVPLKRSAFTEERLRVARGTIRKELRALWRAYLKRLDLSLPLLIMDEAHHLKNETRLSGVLANPEETGEDAEEIEKGPLGGVFDRMLFLTATPFQLGHHELIKILGRFEGIRWSGNLDRSKFRMTLADLERRLGATQAATLRFDYSWGRLQQEDFAGRGQGVWWENPDDPGLPGPLQNAARHLSEVRSHIQAVNDALRPWIIRHLREDRESRRTVLCGRAILDDKGLDNQGLQVTGGAVLPFLLAARAQSLVAAEELQSRRALRAYFAEGLASSFEAYRDTRRHEISDATDDLEPISMQETSPEIDWYLKELDTALPESDRESWSVHPKIAATVHRATELWKLGEKVVIFCFYRATGRAIRQHLSHSIEREIVAQGAVKLGLRTDDADAVKRELERVAERFFDPDSPVVRVTEDAVRRLLRESEVDEKDLSRASDVVLRFLRTPGYQVRYVEIGSANPADAFAAALESSGALRGEILRFGRFVAQRVPSEREELFEALGTLQTGSIFATGADLRDDENESQRESLLPNIRLANGATKRQQRRRLMLAFNTPFFPEILIASSVMAEGVDLHLNCRHVIHHDLDWNPSVLEQRTGRLDRLGSKGEVLRKPVVVYEPFLEATQDEKLFRVVKDRERWFSVVMGQQLTLDEWSTEKLAQRVPLPAAAAKTLAMDLSLRDPN